jgi:predicted DNA-binding transcriptional regulator AlpA
MAYENQKNLLTDGDIAHQLGLSRSWVRVERHRRRHGQDHSLTIDPVMVGSVPRYRSEEVTAWIAALPKGRVA